jgi:hypothetical protein
MKTQLLILALTIIISSCKESNITNDYVEKTVEFSLVDENSNDLLDSSNPDHIPYTEIKLTHFLNEDYTNPASVDDRILKLDEKRDGLTVLSIQLNDTGNYEKPITIIDWGNLRTDTLRASFRRGDNGIRVVKAWLNDKLIFDVSDRDLEDGWYQVLKFDVK